MSVEQVKEYLKKFGLLSNYLEFDVSSATVADAAKAIGCEKGRIAKTLCLLGKESPVMIVAMGEAKLDNKLYKQVFSQKAVFIKPEDLEKLVGHPPGGACPFAVAAGVKIFLDESLKAYDPVYPAAGSASNAVKISLQELENITGARWIHVTK